MRFENVKEVDIKAVNGKVRLEAWDEDYAEVSYTPHGEVEVEAEQRGSKLVIKEKPTGKRVLGIFQKSSDGWAEIEVKIPKKAVVTAKMVNGEITAEGVGFENVTVVNGKMELKNCIAGTISSVNGPIKAHFTSAGPLKASTVNGRMEITIEELEEDAEISTVNGSVRLYLTEFCDARISVKRVNGSVHLVNLDEPVIGTGEYEVKIHTVNGSITVELL
ncbi:hypothetical protein E3E23_01120 [Thermococcus sp. CX2]|uniref:DUF4097 family beta strand repeat-containing protein n=1 Tax=Thermococcus sp. CX2 TaxID=163006 RepID=UPI00143999B5|nr:DUF4097 family beta strand repeat-containing protein [Thermococcus sp. CX2]NJE84447.1 hypothetical protein [Thermococcus sp. CX2]